MPKQVKSKERVAKHGEVFTNEREVNAMLDLVKDETLRIDSRFLEPACGEGNFCKEILKRKLDVVAKKYKNREDEFQKQSLIALMSCYGVELMQDNVDVCINNLFEIWENYYVKYCKKCCDDGIKKIAKFILRKNILCGNALTLKKVNEDANDTEDPIIFCEWSFAMGDLVKRRDFRLDELLEKESNFTKSQNGSENLLYDELHKEWIPRPIKEYDLIDYRKLTEASNNE